MGAIADVVQAYSRRVYMPLKPVQVQGISHLIQVLLNFIRS